MKSQTGAKYLARKNRQEQVYIAEIPASTSKLVRLGNGVVKRVKSLTRETK